MPEIWLVLAVFAFVLCLILLGVPIGFAFFIAGLAGAFFLLGGQTALNSLAITASGEPTKIALTAIPAFLLMGFFASEFGFGADIFTAAYKWFGWVPGGLAVGALIGSAGFASLTGSSVAETAAMGAITWPEMRKHGYSPRLALPTIAAGGAIGVMIPPSIAFIVIGIITEQSIGALFMSGILPGILETILYIALVVFWVKLSPRMAPSTSSSTWGEKFSSLKGVWPPALIAGLVLGGIYSGIFTPTEAGAVGAFSVLVAGLAMRKVTLKSFVRSVLQTVRISGLVFLIIIGVLFFTNFVAMSGLTKQFVEWVGGMSVSTWVVWVIIVLLYIVLGMFMDALGMYVLTLPLVYPLVIKLGMDGILFAVVLVVLSELGCLTPPVGMNVFTLKGMAPDVNINDIWIGCIPFCLVDILVIIILVIFPQIALILPQTMMKGL